MSDYLLHQCLIAMPDMADSFFAGTVTYILQHDTEGALGVIINQPLALNIEEVLDGLSIESEDQALLERPVLKGGPVSPEQGFVLHPVGAGSFKGSIQQGETAMTTSRDVLESLAAQQGPNPFLFCLGYSGWSAGQLEQELKQNAWLVAPADDELLYHAPIEDRYRLALSRLGIDPGMLNSSGGHA